MTDLLPIALPAWLTPQLMVSALVIVIVLHVALGAAAYGIWLERKLSAWVQDRVGPNRVGPFGLLQPIADGLKLITKEEFRPRGCGCGFVLHCAFLVGDSSHGRDCGHSVGGRIGSFGVWS